MRTTVRLDENLLREAKRVAAESGRTFTQLMEDSLRETLARRNARQSREPVELLTFNGGGVLPGVDLNDSAGLLDIMEATDDPP